MPFSMVFSNIKFEPAFHLAILWMAVLLVFSKGLRSYGKTVYFVVLIPIVTLCLVCGQLIATGRQQGFLFLESYAGFSWLEGLQNPEQWVAVSREVFFVWGLNGCAVMQMASHNRRNRRIAGEAVFVAVLVLAPLLLASFACGSCLHILAQAGFRYVPSSFETHRTFDFLRNRNSVDGDWNATVSSLFFGAVFSPPHVMFTSGYAPLQFATEIFPAATLVLGSVALSPFWSMLFYFSMTALGFAALLVTWKTVVEMIVSLKPSFLKKWEVTVAFLGCSSALVFSLLYASGVGIHALYFMDNCLGSGWWIMVLYVLLLLGLLCVRGKPYSGENIASVFLFPSKESCGARTVQIFLAFLWTVILPTVLLVTAVISFAHGTFRQMLNWELVEEPFVAWEKLDTTFSDDTEAPEPINSKFYMHWSDLARHLGGWIQVAPLLAVPLVASIQCIWYLSCGPSNVIERMMKLCRPSLSMDSNNGRHSDERHSFHCHQCQQQGHQNNIGLFDEHSEVGDAPEVVEADVPPKYTPPPSYSTATGTMLAKFLRRSFRHSLQHIQGLLHSSSSSPRGSVDATSAAAAATAATNGGFVISDDPAGNDSSSDGPPRETHYTLRAAERRRSNSHRTHTPPPDYNDLTSSDSFRSLGSSTSSTSTSSSTAAAGSFRLLRALQRTLSQRSRGMIMRMDNDDDEEVAATVGEDQQQQHRGRLVPSSAGATELVSVSTIDLESIDSTDA